MIQEILELFTEYIDSELYSLVLILFGLGIVLKKSKKIDNTSIPFILMLVSILITTCFILSTTEVELYTLKVVSSMIFSILIQAGLCTGGAIGISQGIIQMKKRKQQDKDVYENDIDDKTNAIVRELLAKVQQTKDSDIDVDQSSDDNKQYTFSNDQSENN